ncbi:MAG TPA: hypothetical protein VEL03_00810 [Streptosporangiaceae bacterium]|nr:hypothetical protein [Streptosporangiaceae bacterium]
MYFAVMPAAVLTLAVGCASASYEILGSGGGSASVGTVTLSINGPATHTCVYSALVPGDVTGATCAFSVIYTGSVTAYLELTVSVTASAGSGGQPLYNGSDTSGLTITISDGHASYTAPTGPGTTGGACPARSTCWTQRYDLAAWYTGSSPRLTFSAGDITTFTIVPALGSGSGPGYEGGAASVTLTAHAVQAPANPLPASCTTASIGQPCPPSGSFTWS